MACLRELMTDYGRMNFIRRDDDPPFNRTLEKLMTAGWIYSTEIRDREPGVLLASIRWTDDGREKMRTILALLSEIEQNSHTLQNDEMPWIKILAQHATMIEPP